MHTGDPVATADSELVRRLKAAGCIVLGKTNTPEFGHKGKTDNIPFGATLNPWNTDYTPGGSSGGSAAALAAGIIPLATGSDGGGSIRAPSAICGLSGIKTSQRWVMYPRIFLCETALSKLESAGVTVIHNDNIWTEDPLKNWLVFWCSARARAQQHLMDTDDWEKIDPMLRVMIEIGADRMTGPAYASAIDAAHRMNFQLETAFEEAALILTPATCGHTPTLEGDGLVNGTETANWVGFTMGINMTRNPAGIVPIGTSDAGLPLALQVIGRQRADLSVLLAIRAMEDVFEFTDHADIDHQ